ncbi:hypothetical protein [Streptomyces sp. HUAS TT7]|uniref:hypothetical protein n=1 Tax=Streptomyces sp. HUAS TT7 TaxID=3447507 RepID=UPI003F65CB75
MSDGPGTAPTTTADEDPNATAASARGTAGELVLTMYGRIPVDSPKLDGDRRVFGLLAAWDPEQWHPQSAGPSAGALNSHSSSYPASAIRCNARRSPVATARRVSSNPARRDPSSSSSFSSEVAGCVGQVGQPVQSGLVALVGQFAQGVFPGPTPPTRTGQGRAAGWWRHMCGSGGLQVREILSS